MIWVSVKQREPDFGVRVLAMSLRWGLITTFLTGSYEWCDLYGKVINDAGITHWMELPEQPDESEECECDALSIRGNSDCALHKPLTNPAGGGGLDNGK